MGSGGGALAGLTGRRMLSTATPLRVKQCVGDLGHPHSLEEAACGSVAPASIRPGRGLRRTGRVRRTNTDQLGTVDVTPLCALSVDHA